MATSYVDIAKNLGARYKDIDLKYEVDAINNSISNLLTISKGEVPGRPELGSNLADFLFELNDAVTWAAIEQVVRNAILEFEPRINVLSGDFKGYNSQNMVVLTVTYVVIKSGTQGVFSKTFEV